MARPLPAPRPCLPPSPHHQYWPAAAAAAAASSHSPDMQLSASLDEGSFRSSHERAVYSINSQNPAHDAAAGPDGNASFAAMQFANSTSAHDTASPQQQHTSGWSFLQQPQQHQQSQPQQQQQQQQSQQSGSQQQQQQQQQQQHQQQHVETQHPSSSSASMNFLPDSSLASWRGHQFATPHAPASLIVSQQRQPMHHFSMAEQHPHSHQMRMRGSIFPESQDPHLMFQMDQLQYNLQNPQAMANLIPTGPTYHPEASMSQQMQQTIITSPQTYRHSLDPSYSGSVSRDAALQDFVYYPQDDASPPQAAQFSAVTFDIMPQTNLLDGGDLSPSSTLSSSVIGDTFVAHTPDSFTSMASAFEGTGISANGMALHAHNGSFASHQSGMSVSSASPHDIWQQPSSSPENLMEEVDDLVHDTMQAAASAHDDDCNSCQDSHSASSETTSWPVSPDSTRSSASSTTTTHRPRKTASTVMVAGKVAAKTISKKPSAKKEAQVVRALAEKLDTKRTGRRKGPLTSDQRRQAGEIRKLKACIRCKFLKKVCDPNSPCAGCKPSHARLWTVPCTRLDIRELHYFMDEWRVDFERHVTSGITVSNVIDYAPREQQIFIGHGFGDFISISAREVYVRDDNIFKVDWVETIGEKPDTYEAPTSHLVIGRAGLSEKLLDDYLDRHIDKSFNIFVVQMFEGTKVWTELLLTLHTLYQKTRMPMLRNALKFFISYNLTQHVTYEENALPEAIGTIGDIGSKHTGKTLAPVLLNYEIKVALSRIWRDLHRKLLSDLSTLFSSVYNGQKQKNWALIMMLSSVLLMVWEEMQFDSHYRMEHVENATKFCQEMESVPVGVITGLFSTISQRMPALRDWDSAQHGEVFNGHEFEKELCEAVEKAKDIMITHENYLRKRDKAQFDEQDFDSLCNKFVHKILLRPS